LTRAWVPIAFTAGSLAAALLWPAVPQPTDYHDFADRRTLLGVDNFFNVVSNAAFLAVGLLGLVIVARRRARFVRESESLPYAVFFIGVTLTAVGSAWYHLAPDNERLFWDRLPMTIAFMSLIAAQIGDRVDARVGLALLGPMLLAGIASVLYWIGTERAGTGNVVPYVVLQGYSLVILLLLAMTLPSRYSHGAYIHWVFGGYVVAKALEFLDREIMALGGVISGHSLKHVAAAVARLFICRMLWLRTPTAAGAGKAALAGIAAYR
jgi:hypothetical protein